MAETSKQFFERAREATHRLRDAAREGAFMDAHVRDPLVMAIHDVIDLCETVTAGKAPCGHPSAYVVKDDEQGASLSCLQCRAEKAEAENDALRDVIAGNGQARVELMKNLEAAEADVAILKRLIETDRVAQCRDKIDTAAAGEKLHQRAWDLLRYCRGYLSQEGLISLAEYAWLVSNGSYATGGDPSKPGQGSPGPRRLESYDQMRERLTRLDAMEAALRGTVDLIEKWMSGILWQSGITWESPEHHPPVLRTARTLLDSEAK